MTPAQLMPPSRVVATLSSNYRCFGSLCLPGKGFSNQYHGGARREFATTKIPCNPISSRTCARPLIQNPSVSRAHLGVSAIKPPASWRHALETSRSFSSDADKKSSDKTSTAAAEKESESKESTSTASETPIIDSATASSTVELNVPPPTWRQLRVYGMACAVPMVGFGFMDNIIMIQVGDLIDSSLGVTFGLATITAAAMGQVIIKYFFGYNINECYESICKFDIHGARVLWAF